MNAWNRLEPLNSRNIVEIKFCFPCFPPQFRPRRPRGGKKRRDERFQAQAEKPLGPSADPLCWVPTLTGPFPDGQANAGSWLGTTKWFVLLCPIGEQFFLSSFREFVHDGYLNSITACLAHAPKKCMQSGNFQFDMNSPFQNTVYPKTKDAFPKIQAWAYKRYSPLLGSLRCHDSWQPRKRRMKSERGRGQGAGRVRETGEERAGSGREIQKVKLSLFVTPYIQSKKRTQQRFLTPINVLRGLKQNFIREKNSCSG